MDLLVSGESAGPPGRPSTGRRPGRWPAVVAMVLVLLGVLGVAVRLDAPSDGTRITDWVAGGVVVAVDAPGESSTGTPARLADGDLVREIGDQSMADRPGALPRPDPSAILDYRVEQSEWVEQSEGVARSVASIPVSIGRPTILPLLRYGWGNLVFVVTLALLAVCLYVRRPEEPSTSPLLVAAGGLLGSTLVVVAGIPALTMATGGPLLWLYNLNIVGAYAVSWGAVLAFGLLLLGGTAVSRRRLVGAWCLPPMAMVVLLLVAALRAGDWAEWFGLVYAGTTVIVLGAMLLLVVLGILGYRTPGHPEARARLRCVAAGSIVTAVLSIGLWHLPQLVVGHSLLPPGALGLAGLPFIIGVGVALWRHRLFDIERLANRSLTYLAVTVVLVAGYALVVALLGNVLGLSGGMAAALAAMVAAIALAPVLRMARRGVNRLMYGDRDDPAGVLAQLGSRMQAAMLPDDVLPAVVETVAESLRLPYVAIDLPDETGGFRMIVERGRPVGVLHLEELSHHGSVVGRLRVSGRGIDDPLEPADLVLLRSLAGEIGPAVQAVRLHQDLVRSRAEVVALREDERRRLRRDLHDGLGPALAAIGLKAGLARREVPAESRAYDLLGEIDGEVKASLGGIRRLVEGLRPPALDELGLVGALRTRAATLAANLEVEVTGELADRCLPAAVEAAAYWIAVEAMTNAARHSGGTRCVVDLQLFHRVLVLVVADDGRGLDSSRPSGVGLNSMRERAVEVGGTLVVPATTEGTEVVARLPLELGGVDDHADPR